MRSRAGLHVRVRFLATTLLLVAARAFDAITTRIATRDLSLESNPLTRLLHVGWAGLLLANGVVVLVLAVGIWCAVFAPPSPPTEPALEFKAFVARYWFSRGGRRSPWEAALWLPADRRVRWAFIGGPGVALVIVASIAAGIWNLLVARHVVLGRTAGQLGLMAFWGGLVIGLVIAVRVYLSRAYACYTRAAAGPRTAEVATTP